MNDGRKTTPPAEALLRGAPKLGRFAGGRADFTFVESLR